MAAAVQATAAGQYLSPGSLTAIFGSLWYDHQELLRPAGGCTRRDGSIPEQAADAGPPGAEAGTPGLVLLYTTLATWHLLTSPDGARLSQQPVPAAEQAADRAAGLVSRGQAASVG